MVNNDTVIVADRLIFCFLMIPAIYIGLVYGFITACIIVISVVIVRLVIQFIMRNRITGTMSMLPWGLDRRSTDIIVLFSIVSMGISYNEGKLFGFITVALIIGAVYVTTVIIFSLVYHSREY